MLCEVKLPDWQHVFRHGLAPILSTAELLALATGLREDDPDIIQGDSTFPSPLTCNDGLKIQAGCGLCYAVWRGRELETIGDVYNAFLDVLGEANARLGNAGECGHFVRWFDEGDREQVRTELLAEVEREIGLRVEGAR